MKRARARNIKGVWYVSSPGAKPAECKGRAAAEHLAGRLNNRLQFGGAVRQLTAGGRA